MNGLNQIVCNLMSIKWRKCGAPPQVIKIQIPSTKIRLSLNTLLCKVVFITSVTLDCNVSIKTHVQKKASCCLAILIRIQSIQNSISASVLEALVASLVMPYLDQRSL